MKNIRYHDLTASINSYGQVELYYMDGHDRVLQGTYPVYQIAGNAEATKVFPAFVAVIGQLKILREMLEDRGKQDSFEYKEVVRILDGMRECLPKRAEQYHRDAKDKQE